MEQKTIYLVDDDDGVRQSAHMLLEAKGFSVRAFSSPANFLKETDGTGADCLLLDVHMPGMNGAELLEFLRRKGIRTPVVVLTGRPDGAITARLSRAGASAILEKPIETSVLLAAISAALTSAA